MNNDVVFVTAQQILLNAKRFILPFFKCPSKSFIKCFNDCMVANKAQKRFNS